MLNPHSRSLLKNRLTAITHWYLLETSSQLLLILAVGLHMISFKISYNHLANCTKDFYKPHKVRGPHVVQYRIIKTATAKTFFYLKCNCNLRASQ